MLIDYMADKAKGEALDLKHGADFFPGRMEIGSSGDMKAARGSDIIVITAGVRQREGESRLSLIERNLDIFKTIIPPLVESSPNAILIIVSNPCDVLTYAAWKISGLPLNQGEDTPPPPPPQPLPLCAVNTFSSWLMGQCSVFEL